MYTEKAYMPHTVYKVTGDIVCFAITGKSSKTYTLCYDGVELASQMKEEILILIKH